MKFDMADVKPSLVSFVIVGLMALVFIVAAKAALNRVYVPGLTELANAA